MKLSKLSSNNPGFKELVFKDGLNILAGLQLTESEKQSYNGIGKSFSLYLIHLLMGGEIDKSNNRGKKVHDFLASYGEFFLEFTQSSKKYIIEKNFSEPHSYINGEKILKKDFSNTLRGIIIGEKVTKSISLKQILNIFARRYGGSYYSEATSQQGRPLQDYHQMFSNLKLLGIDTDLIAQKSSIKKKQNKLKTAKKVIKEYELLLEQTNVKDLKDNLAQLIKEKENFVIAENYDKFKNDADLVTVEINKKRSEIYLVNQNMVRKEESLEQCESVSIDLEKVKNIYNEANFFFKEMVNVRLEDANHFHEKLTTSRVNRLMSEIKLLKSDVAQKQEELLSMETYRDNILKDLDSKGALEEYNSINERIRTLDGEIQELEKYDNILEGFRKDSSTLTLENAKVQAKSLDYLDQIENHLEDIENVFRSLVKKFYKNKGGSLEITETVDAQYLYNIDVNIPRDGSQGVNEVKIFCYDFLLYQLNRELLGFMAHDGCIFSEMDPRQKTMIFKVVLEQVQGGDLQYFVNIGEASLNEVLDIDNKLNILSKEEKEEIERSVILKLYDKDPSKWLMGCSFG